VPDFDDTNGYEIVSYRLERIDWGGH
jgi:hypothetical protein